jgi:monoterpene epsilon-lactone hydrolase
MASAEYEAFRATMAARPSPPPASLEEQRARIDAAMGALPLAAGVVATEFDADGVPLIECRPADLRAGSPTLVYLHGGGFRLASALAYRAYASHLAAALGARVVLVDYRLAPEHPYPAALDDALGAIGWLVAEGADPKRMVVAGDSAGGGLAASVALRTIGHPHAPAAIVCCSPWVDLTVTAASYDTNAATDLLFPRASAEAAAPLYLAGHDPTDPMVSPVFGAWTGAPPMLIQVGDIESLLDDARALHSRASAAGANVTLRVYPEMPHIWQMSYPAFPEAIAAVEEIGVFVHDHTG